MFAEWNEGELRSYLVEITARVLAYVDAETGTPLVDLILDEAQQKGTGKWMSQNAFDIGAPIPTVNAAVEARLLSALKTERVAASDVLDRAVAAGDPRRAHATRRGGGTGALREQDHVLRAGDGDAAAGIGGVRLRHRSGHRSPSIWRAGCIIRATLLSDIRAAFRRDAVRSRTCCWMRRFATPSPSGRTSGAHVVQTAVGRRHSRCRR